MSVWIKVLLIFVVFVIFVILTRRVIKKVMGIGQLKAGEFKAGNSSFNDWAKVFAQPGNIRVETLHAGDVPGTVYGMINLKDKELNIKDESLTAPLMAHLISHQQFGDFLIDTGFDNAFSEKPWGRFEGLLKKHFKYFVPEGQGIVELLASRNVTLKGVFCTHFHEHQGGAPSLPDDIPFVFGKGEKEMDFFPLIYTRFLIKKSDLRAIDFDKADEMPILGKSVDLFGDGSFWAISTPGHTKGHVTYLVNGAGGRFMIIGDVCMCQKGFDLGVESGGMYADDMGKNRESFVKIKKFLDAYPDVKPVFGHESEEFRIKYR